ncbi:MAG: hypothetical protein NTX87_06940 [Planctomycetota bacterium]|nr:hypothetical protein [Planctomycetota bacterium]
MTLADYLASCEQRYSAEAQLLGGPFHGPGYHSRVQDGTYVHDILNSLNYAVALLMSGDAAHVSRAADVLRKALSLQDADPTSPTYGLWPWLLEEPLAGMALPDPNWADFCGARLAQILKDHAGKLPADLADPVRAGLGHAAWSIFRRNVDPAYTNVAIAGAGVTLAAGELLGAPRLLDYGRRRLRNLVRHTKFHGGFNEYNSPTYTLVALHECERMLSLLGDAQARSDADWLRCVAWLTIAEHYHPGTCQWAGPHSRAYGLRLAPGAAEYLANQTGTEIALHPPGGGERRSAPPQYPALECPTPLKARFRKLPKDELEVRRRFIRRDSDATSTWGTTWFAGDACLGSASRDNLWTQRHVLIGYWRAPEDPAVVLRLRFLHDGRDFASAFVRSVQAGPRVLSVFNLATDLGDFHHYLDRPADGVFTAEDFRVRYELSGAGVMAQALGAGRFVLAAGGRRAVVHTMPGRFGPYEVRWTFGKEGDCAFVDGVCYHESRLPFDLARLGKIILAAGVELLTPLDSVAEAPPALEEHTEDSICVVWGLPAGGLMVTAPTHPHPYPK